MFLIIVLWTILGLQVKITFLPHFCFWFLTLIIYTAGPHFCFWFLTLIIYTAGQTYCLINVWFVKHYCQRRNIRPCCIAVCWHNPVNNSISIWRHIDVDIDVKMTLKTQKRHNLWSIFIIFELNMRYFETSNWRQIYI